MRIALVAVLFVVAPLRAADPDVEALAAVLTGHFSSLAQSKAEPSYFDVHLHAARVWDDKPGDCWLYVEQAMATALEKPYRQRVYHLVKGADGKLASVVYHLPGDALKFAGAWKQPKPLADLKPSDLVEKKGCAIFLTKNADGSFTGATTGKDCPTELNGGAYATSEVKLTKERLETWDRGYDKDGKQVWGAKAGPYKFDRVAAKPQ